MNNAIDKIMKLQDKFGKIFASQSYIEELLTWSKEDIIMLICSFDILLSSSEASYQIRLNILQHLTNIDDVAKRMINDIS